MNVLVPFVRLHPRLVAALAAEGVQAQFVDTSAGDAYWRTLRIWWMGGGSFVVLEQDKVPEPGLLSELWSCKHDWCTVRVDTRGGEPPAPYPSLSCTKFSARLIADAPRLLEQVGELDFGLGEREWSRLDLGIAGLLGGVYARNVHWHEGRVEHLHEEAA